MKTRSGCEFRHQTGSESSSQMKQHTLNSKAAIAFSTVKQYRQSALASMALRAIIPLRVSKTLSSRSSTLQLPCAATVRSPLVRIEPRTQRPAFQSIRWHSAPSGRPRVYEYNDIKRLSETPSPERVIIDVREPSEYQDGYIPGAINIPVKSQPDAIFLPEEEFEDRFGFSKPTQDQEVIFYCKAGVRSSAAATLAQQQGYPNISDYRGSWLDWVKNGGAVERP